MRAVVKGVAGLAGVGVAAFAGTSAVDDNTTRNDDGAIVESGGLGAFQMRVGDCFNDPSASSELVASVEGVPCTQLHDNEVFAEFDVTNAEFPGADPLFEEAWFDCYSRFEGWVGIPFEDSSLGISAFTPSAESWEEGDREVTCFVFDYEGKQLSISTKGLRL